MLAAASAFGAAATHAPTAALVAAAVVAVAAAVLAWPWMAAPVAVFSIWINLPGILVDRYGISALAAAAFPLVMVIALLEGRRRGERFAVDRTFALILALLAVELVSTLASAHQDVAIERVEKFVVGGVLVYPLVLNAVRTPAALRRVVWALLAAGSFLAVVTVYQQLTKSWYRPYLGFGEVDSAFFRGQSAVARLAGPLGDPNYYAQILIPLVPIGVLMWLREGAARARLAARCATAVICLAIAFTYSRGAAIALGTVLAGMVALRCVRARYLVVTCATLGVLAVAVPAYRDRIATIPSAGSATAAAGEATTADESSRSRTTEMLAAWLAFLDHPLLGVGPGGFPAYYQVYAPRVGIEVRETTTSGAHKGEAAQREAHDIALGAAADTGVLGAGVLGAIVLMTMRGLLRARRRWLGRRPDLVSLANGLFLALLGYLVAGLFLSLAFERYFWLLIAIAGAAGGLALRAPADARTNAATRSS